MGSETVRGWHTDYCLPSLEYGVRWAGFISPSIAGEYTFSVLFSDAQATPDDRVKVYVFAVYCVCEHACIFVRVDLIKLRCDREDLCIYTYIYVYVYMYMYIYVYIHTYIFMYTYL